MTPAHSLVLDMQSALLKARAGHGFEWLSLEKISWVTAIALIDLILGVV